MPGLNNKTLILLASIFLLFSLSNSYSQSGWYPLNSGTSNDLNSVFFIDNTFGYMVGNNIRLKTTNGGLNWFSQATAINSTCVHFLNVYTGYSSGNTVFKTVDGGNNWTDLVVSNIRALFFVDVNTGYCAGLNSTIIKTNDGGQTWTAQSVSTQYNTFNSVNFITAENGYLVGGRYVPPFYGVLYQTTNGGVTWNFSNTQSLDVEFRSVHFPVPDVGYVVGAYELGSSGVIYKTEDGGNTWVQQGITNRDLAAVYFIDAFTGYAVGDEGTIIKTTNGGIIWYSQPSGTSQDINSVHFRGSNLGYIAGASGTVKKTVNGGMPGPPFGISGFVRYNTNGQPVTGGYIKALKYDYNTNQILLIDSTSILPNGFYQLTNCPTDSLDIMAYADDELEFVPTYHGNTIFWMNSITLYPTSNLVNIDITVFRITNPFGYSGMIGGGVFSAQQTNYLGLKDAYVYAKIGNEFKNFAISGTGGPYSIGRLPNGSYELICDRMGYRSATRFETLNSMNLDTINFYLNAVHVIGIQNQNLYTPSAFRLEQNYPNPFNPVTNIRFDVPERSRVKVIVIDVLGREIEALVNEDLNPGTYKVDWNASKYTSGIYFYTLTAGSYVTTKKMVLVK